MKPSSLIFATVSLLVLLFAWSRYASNHRERELAQMVFEDGRNLARRGPEQRVPNVSPATAPMIAVPTPQAESGAQASPVENEVWVPTVLDGKSMSAADWLKLNEAQRKVQTAYEFVGLGFPELSGEQRLRLKELLALRISGIALPSVLATDGTTVSGRDANEAELRALLGERYGELGELMALDTITLELGTHPGLLTKFFQVSGVPLSDESRLRLAKLFKQHGWEMAPGVDRAAQLRLPADPILGVRPIYAQLIDEARAFLSPEQVMAFVDYARSGEASVPSRN